MNRGLVDLVGVHLIHLVHWARGRPWSKHGHVVLVGFVGLVQLVHVLSSIGARLDGATDSRSRTKRVFVSALALKLFLSFHHQAVQALLLRLRLLLLNSIMFYSIVDRALIKGVQSTTRLVVAQE